MEIKTGDSVMVKPGVKDPDYEYDITGWQGRVTQIDTGDGIYVEIAWDSLTLDQMPAEYLEISLEEGFEYYLMWLSENEVVRVEPRDQPKSVEQEIRTLNEQFGYISADKQHQYILQILNGKDLSVSKENLAKFHDYLIKHIKYPCLLTGMEDFSWEEPYLLGVFDQKEYEQLKKKRASYTDQFSLLNLEDHIDGLQGILVKVKRTSDNRTFVLPLWDLKTVDQKDRNHPIIDNYAYWMTNYR